MPTPEMLKKLLDEFAEKEAHTREEVNAISQQIEELERRITISQQKLAAVGVDRDKVRTMQARYRAGLYDSVNTPGPSPQGADLIVDLQAERSVEPSKITAPAPRAAASRLRTMPDLTAAPPGAEEPAKPAAAPSPVTPPAPAPAPPAHSPFVSQSRLRSLSEPPPPPPPPDSSPVTASQAIEELFLNQQAHLEPASQPEPAAPPPWPAVPAPPAPSPAAALSKSSFFSEPDPDFDALESTATPQAPAPIVDMPAPAPPAPPAPAVPPRGAMPSFGDDDEFEKEMEALAASSAQPAAPAADPEEAASSPVISDLEEESDDTVKSINDALRGLFR